VSKGANHIETNDSSAEVSEESAEYTDLIVEPIDFGEIKRISDRKAFYGLLLPQKNVVLDTSKSKGQRLDAAVTALGLYRLRINYLSTELDFEGIQETIEHYNGWSHHIESALQVPGFTKNFDLLKVSSEEVSELGELAAESRAGDLEEAKPKVPSRGPRIIKFIKYVRSGWTPAWGQKAALHGSLLDLDREYPPSPFAE